MTTETSLIIIIQIVSNVWIIYFLARIYKVLIPVNFDDFQKVEKFYPEKTVSFIRVAHDGNFKQLNTLEQRWDDLTDIRFPDILDTDQTIFEYVRSLGFTGIKSICVYYLNGNYRLVAFNKSNLN